jgi:hypothetical protein
MPSGRPTWSTRRSAGPNRAPGGGMGERDQPKAPPPLEFGAPRPAGWPVRRGWRGIDGAWLACPPVGRGARPTKTAYGSADGQVISRNGYLTPRPQEPETAGVCPEMGRRLNISCPGASPTPLVDGAPQLAASRSRKGHAVLATLRACALDGRPEAHPWHDRPGPTSGTVVLCRAACCRERAIRTGL